MLLIQTKQFTVKTKYFANNNGTPMFQRRIPLALRKFFQNKNHLRIKLTGKQTSMAAEIAHHARDTDRLFNDLRAKNGIDRSEAEAEALLAYYGLRPGDGLIEARVPHGMYDQPHLTDIDEYFTYKTDKGTLTDADELARLLLTKPMPLMLSKCLDIYFANNVKGTQAKFKADSIKHFKNLFTVCGGDVAVENITRDTAKKYIEKRRRTVSTGAVAREISTIRAVFNVVIREKELKINNPFLSLVIPDMGKDRKQRLPYTSTEIKHIIKSCLETPNDQKIILLLCALTGARLAEISGLRRQDCVLDADIPYFNLVEYNQRTLKTTNSQRSVPLVPAALSALKEHLKSHESDLVFPKYNDGIDVDGNRASAAINSFIRRIGIKDKTTHNTRHTMRDLLRHADVPPHIIDAIGGWGSNSVGESYGLGYSLKQKYEALNKALNPILVD